MEISGQFALENRSKFEAPAFSQQAIVQSMHNRVLEDVNQVVCMFLIFEDVIVALILTYNNMTR
jgi:hypothetical protein